MSSVAVAFDTRALLEKQIGRICREADLFPFTDEVCVATDPKELP